MFFLLDEGLHALHMYCMHTGMKNNCASRFQEFRVRRISPITGKLLEMPILLTLQHFLLAHRAFKNHTGDRTLIPYLTESEIPISV